jgi:hypothetical protein
MKKSNLKDRVLAFLKGGDEAKLTRFEGKLDKHLAKQISMREDQIETLEEKIVDAKEDLNETILNVNPDSVNTTEGAESYCVTYLKQVRAKRNVILGYENQIAALQEEIAEFKADEAAIYSVPAEKKA